MARLLGALVFAAFALWHGYRVVRALRTGRFESLGEPLERAARPDLFSYAVVRQALWSALFAIEFVLFLAGAPPPIGAWVLVGWAVLYVTLSIVLLLGRGRASAGRARGG
jgi:hypothetical protein